MKYNAPQYAQALQELAAKTAAKKHRELIRNFLASVLKNGSLPLLPEIIREFRSLSDKSAKIQRVMIKAPKRLAAKGVARKLPFKTRVKSEMDVRLVGGATIEVGDLRVNNSIAMRLQRARAALSR